MTRRVIAFVLLAMAVSTLGCVCGGLDVGTVYFGGVGAVRGSGKVVEEERQMSGFTGVQLAGFGDLIVDVGDKESLRIRAEDNLIQHFETKVHNYL